MLFKMLIVLLFDRQQPLIYTASDDTIATPGPSDTRRLIASCFSVSSSSAAACSAEFILLSSTPSRQATSSPKPTMPAFESLACAAGGVG